jgi:phosphoribosyl-AMP cyclohydrolase
MNINFTKYADGLVPAIVQDAHTKTVLMLGFMNQAAVDASESSDLGAGVSGGMGLISHFGATCIGLP